MSETQTHTSEHLVTPALFGRHEILTAQEEITRENLLDEMTRALAIHSMNEAEIDYLWWYTRGNQPILERVKTVRPEICNRIVENHAIEIVEFASGYLLSEPVFYIRRGERESASEDINLLNDYMYYEDKSSHDKKIATWMAICGQAYRMCLPDNHTSLGEDDSPFELDTLDPRNAFVMYYGGFGHRPMLAAHRIFYESQPGAIRIRWYGYTQTHYFEMEDSQILVWKRHMLPEIPIVEYIPNAMRMGAFEAAIPLLNAINTIMSNRVDGVEQFVQSFLKFKNCEPENLTETVQKLQELGAIVIKTTDGLDGDVQIMAQELNQSQTQTVVDYLYQQVLAICGVPSTTKGGSSTSDTGTAVYLRDGWGSAEARARDTELLWKKSERQFLKLALHIIREKREFGLQLSEVDTKFTRRPQDNQQSKAQALSTMLQAGIAPEIAIATCGLFNDPQDVAAQSAAYLQKWAFVPLMEMMANSEGDADA